MKKTKNTNFINALIAGFLVFGCTCQLCSKKYEMSSGLPDIAAIWQKAVSGASASGLAGIKNNEEK